MMPSVVLHSFVHSLAQTSDDRWVLSQTCPPSKRRCPEVGPLSTRLTRDFCYNGPLSPSPPHPPLRGPGLAGRVSLFFFLSTGRKVLAAVSCSIVYVRIRFSQGRGCYRCAFWYLLPVVIIFRDTLSALLLRLSPVVPFSGTGARAHSLCRFSRISLVRSGPLSTWRNGNHQLVLGSHRPAVLRPLVCSCWLHPPLLLLLLFLFQVRSLCWLRALQALVLRTLASQIHWRHLQARGKLPKSPDGLAIEGACFACCFACLGD